jgi:hypothetical protein
MLKLKRIEIPRKNTYKLSNRNDLFQKIEIVHNNMGL